MGPPGSWIIFPSSVEALRCPMAKTWALAGGNQLIARNEPQRLKPALIETLYGPAGSRAPSKRSGKLQERNGSHMGLTGREIGRFGSMRVTAILRRPSVKTVNSEPQGACRALDFVKRTTRHRMWSVTSKSRNRCKTERTSNAGALTHGSSRFGQAFGAARRLNFKG